ncbi:MAG TPA: glycosyltransferase family 4 protein [Bryobacteraceae bacterium]|nr:glycosyltransferase family 4 protein [Bryobacteraceae bacterium]
MTADAVGGVWTYSLELARALASKGVKICLATMGPVPSPDQRAQASAIPGLELRASDYQLEWMQSPWPSVDAAGDWLLGLEKEFRPDLIHLNGYVHGTLAWNHPVIVVAHSCVCSWWNAVRRSEAPAEWNEYRWRVREGLLAADARVAVSGFMASELQRWYGQPSDVRVIYNARNASAYRPGKKQDFVLSCGRLWDEAKNIEALDQAAGCSLWPVAVAGDAKHPAGRDAQFEFVYPLGQVSATELRSWYSRASIYALPARYEPFGLSALEAGLSGCALVLGDTPSLREIWGDSALFVPPEDAEAVAVAINLLARKQGLREQMSERARSRALSYSTDRMLNSYLEVYSALIAGKTAPCI